LGEKHCHTGPVLTGSVSLQLHWPSGYAQSTSFIVHGIPWDTSEYLAGHIDGGQMPAPLPLQPVVMQ
jgi:hypothetical protein